MRRSKHAVSIGHYGSDRHSKYRGNRQNTQGNTMELKLNNIGIIKNANITLDGLTVIAGENDTGKSTVGKVLYSKRTFQMITKSI
jgi:predicted ATPase